MPWLLVIWRRKEPGHQQSWYWPGYPRIVSLVSSREQSNQTTWACYYVKHVDVTKTDGTNPENGWIATVMHIVDIVNYIPQIIRSYCALVCFSVSFMVYIGHFVPVSMSYTESKMWFWCNFHDWLHWKLSFWQLPVQLMMKISSKFPFQCIDLVNLCYLQRVGDHGGFDHAYGKRVTCGPGNLSFAAWPKSILKQHELWIGFWAVDLTICDCFVNFVWEVTCSSGWL